MNDIRNILWITKHNNLTLKEKTLVLHIKTLYIYVFLYLYV